MADPYSAENPPKRRGRKPGSTLSTGVGWKCLAHDNLVAQRNDLLLAIGEAMCAAKPLADVESLIYRALALKTALDAVDAIPNA